MRALLTVVVFLSLAATARASTLTQVYFDEDGNPTLSAFVTSGDPSTFVEWRRCAADGSPCAPLPGGARTAVGETPAGTSFEAVYDAKTVRTPAWTGRMAVTAPSLSGDVAVGGTIAFVPATWSGGWTKQPGWGPSVRTREIIACPTATGGDCWVVDFTNGARPGELEQGVTLDQRWAGWYLFATEARAAGDLTVLGFIPPPYALGERAFGPRSGPGIEGVSEPVGPVCCATTPAAAPAPASAQTVTPKAPSASIRKRALRRNGRLVIGTVTCPQRCTVRLKVTGKGRPIIRTLRVTGVKTLNVPVRRGRLNVRVSVDGKLVASGRITAR